jgi:hypothetical protein
MAEQPDPITGSSLHLFGEMTRDMKTAIAGLPPEALNWKPAGEDSNSISALAYHSLMSTRQWLCVAFDQPLPDRDRESEFAAWFPDAASIDAFIGKISDECRTLIKDGRGTDWSGMRRHWSPTEEREFPAAWALLHALEHLREHVGQIGLTRQVWKTRTA